MLHEAVGHGLEGDLIEKHQLLQTYQEKVASKGVTTDDGTILIEEDRLI